MASPSASQPAARAKDWRSSGEASGGRRRRTTGRRAGLTTDGTTFWCMGGRAPETAVKPQGSGHETVSHGPQGGLGRVPPCGQLSRASGGPGWPAPTGPAIARAAGCEQRQCGSYEQPRCHRAKSRAAQSRHATPPTDREPQPVPVPSQATTAKPVGRGLGGPEGQGTATAGAKGDRFSRGGEGCGGCGGWLALFSPLYKTRIGGILVPPPRSSAIHLASRASQLAPSGKGGGAAV